MENINTSARMDEVGVNYCSNCGAALGEADNYCPQCGTQCRKTTPRDDEPPTEDNADEDDSGLLAFRRRVQDRLVEGWDLVYDNGDSVVLVDRAFGSLWIHVLLFLFTAGAGNLVYAWYKYSYDADRIVMRADRDGHEYDEKYRSGDKYGMADNHDIAALSNDGSTGRYLAGGLLLFIGIVMIATAPLDPVALTLGVLLLCGFAWIFPPARHRLENRHPVTTFGRTRSTDEVAITDADSPCLVCASPIEEGVERTYREEYVVAGVPLFTTEAGTNTYCRNCASGEITDVGVPLSADHDQEERDERVPELDEN